MMDLQFEPVLIRYERRDENVARAWFRYSSKLPKFCVLIGFMGLISEAEFGRIIAGILEDREVIIRHNPIGTEEETLLWMLLSCLASYLSLENNETPCFTGRPNAATYAESIRFILRDRKQPDFDEQPYLDKLTQK